MGKIIGLLLGIVFVIIGLFMIISHTKKLKRLKYEGSEVFAIIEKIEGTAGDSETASTLKAYISYTVAGTNYRAELDYLSNKMKVGDTIKIYVNENNPIDFISESKSPVIWGGISFVGGIALIVAILLGVFDT